MPIHVEYLRLDLDICQVGILVLIGTYEAAGLIVERGQNVERFLDDGDRALNNMDAGGATGGAAGDNAVTNNWRVDNGVADPIRVFIVLSFLYFVVAKWLIIGFAIAHVENYAPCRLTICWIQASVAYCIVAKSGELIYCVECIRSK
jgi:hypothetical protein